MAGTEPSALPYISATSNKRALTCCSQTFLLFHLKYEAGDVEGNRKRDSPTFIDGRGRQDGVSVQKAPPVPRTVALTHP